MSNTTPCQHRMLADALFAAAHVAVHDRDTHCHDGDLIVTFWSDEYACNVSANFVHHADESDADVIGFSVDGFDDDGPSRVSNPKGPLWLDGYEDDAICEFPDAPPVNHPGGIGLTRSDSTAIPSPRIQTHLRLAS